MTSFFPFPSLIFYFHSLYCLRFTENIEYKVQKTTTPSPSHSLCSFPYCSQLVHLLLLMNTLLTKVHHLHEVSLFVLYSSMSLDKCIPSCSHHCGSFTIVCRHSKSHATPRHSFFPVPIPQVTTNFFLSLQSCLFQNVIAGSIQCAAFSDCLFSPRNTHLRFLHVFSRLDSSFFFFKKTLDNILFYGCITDLFICSSTERHLGCLHISQ